jgi:hypothetical protein
LLGFASAGVIVAPRTFAYAIAAGLLGLTGYTIACGTERWAVKRAAMLLLD